MTAKLDLLGAAASAAFFFGTAAANASVVTVSVSGLQDAGNLGLLTVAGSFIFDSSVAGATSDLSSVSIDDPGISGFSFSGNFPQSFSDNTAIAGGFDGSFDLSQTGSFSNIVNDGDVPICLEAPGGNGSCSGSNPAGLMAFSFSGNVSFSPDDLSVVGAVPVTYTVSAGNVVVPLPAALPLMLTGLAGLGGIAVRRRG